MSHVYKLNGEDPANAWNAVLQAINDVADDCNVTPLDLLEDPARWSKADIQTVHDKLTEMCPGEFDFSTIDDIWKHTTVDEIVEALQEIPDCCCEEEDKFDFPSQGIDGTLTPSGFSINKSALPGSGESRVTFDWAGWIMQEVETLVIEEVECDEETTIEKRSKGRGWVGRGFKSWEMRAKNTTVGNLLIASGTVTEGYIDIGEGAWQDPITCESTDPGDGTLFGEDDPEWRFPYTFSIEDQDHIRDKDGVSIWNNTDGITDNALANPEVVSSPAFIRFAVPIGDVVASDIFLRLKCE